MLASVSTDLQIRVEVSGQINTPDGSNKAGLDRVPFDGYLSELHKGERVLTKREADEQDRMSVPTSVMTGGGGNNTVTNNTNEVNVYADSVDDMLNELERRGIYLDG